MGTLKEQNAPSVPPSRTLPREISPGVFWLGDCLFIRTPGPPLHAYNSVYLITGDECSAVVEAGHPEELALIEEQLDALLAAGAPDVRYIFVTHTETPHASGLARLLQRFPSAVACGDVSDLHLVFPDFSHRFRQLNPGDELELGGTQLRVVQAVFRDHVATRWVFDTRRRVLFAGDGFSFSHYHGVGQCGCVAEEVQELDVPEMVARFAEAAFQWTRFVDIEPYIDQLDKLLFNELRVKTIAPTHGLPITNPEATMPRVRDGLRRGSRPDGPDVRPMTVSRGRRDLRGA